MEGKESKTSERTAAVVGHLADLFNDQLRTTVMKTHFQDIKNESGVVGNVINPTKARGVANVRFKGKKGTSKSNFINLEILLK